MDDRNLANWVGGVALGLVLAAVAWLLVFVHPGRHDDSPSANRRPVDQVQLCIDAAAARAVTGCVAASLVEPPLPSDHRAQRPTRPGPTVTSPPTHAPVSSAPATSQAATSQQVTSHSTTTQATTSQPATTQPANTQPANTQPANTQPANTQPPAQPQRPAAHSGPVPGGTTSSPHTGPRP
jgi:hypothetical protein